MEHSLLAETPYLKLYLVLVDKAEGRSKELSCGPFYIVLGIFSSLGGFSFLLDQLPQSWRANKILPGII